jgi:zinc transport system substrate-binding protein
MLGGLPVMAAPTVVADIAPVHALVAQVMDGVAEPALLIGPGASPHGYALRPSEARALSEADLAIIMGEGLTPWIHDPLESLASNAQVIELLERPETTLLPVREGAHFEGPMAEGHAGHGDEEDHAEDEHDHSEDEHDHSEHDHAEHDHAEDDHDHAEEAGHDEPHDEADHSDHAENAHGHTHTGDDPHAWLDPANGSAWLALIADELAVLDPENADTYRANASAAQDRLTALRSDVTARLAPVGDAAFLTAHDSWQYFEAAFGVRAAGALSDSDAVEPGPARLREVEGVIDTENVTCVVLEGGSGSRMAERLAASGDLRTVTMDPLGGGLTPGAGLYDTLLNELAAGFADCLG